MPFRPQFLATAFVAVGGVCSVLATPTTTKYCSSTVTADYNDISGAAVVAQDLPRPYKGLDYSGWKAVTNAQVGSVQGTVVEVQSPPTSIFFGVPLVGTAPPNTFSVGPGIDHFTLKSFYWACVSAPVGAAGLGGAAGGVNIPLSCTVRATGTKTTGEKVITDLKTGPVLKQKLFTFPETFTNLRSVDFALVQTSAVSGITNGITDVNVDNVAYTLFKTC